VRVVLDVQFFLPQVRLEARVAGDRAVRAQGHVRRALEHDAGVEDDPQPPALADGVAEADPRVGRPLLEIDDASEGSDVGGAVARVADLIAIRRLSGQPGFVAVADEPSAQAEAAPERVDVEQSGEGAELQVEVELVVVLGKRSTVVEGVATQPDVEPVRESGRQLQAKAQGADASGEGDPPPPPPPMP
jgi:hypothetical protein